VNDWKANLKDHFVKDDAKSKTIELQKKEADAKVAAFIHSAVKPAFEDLKTEFEKYGRSVVIETQPTSAKIIVKYKNIEEFWLELQFRGVYPKVIEEFWDNRNRRIVSEGSVRYGVQDYSIDDITPDEIRNLVIDRYRIRTK
jgi:hypothetical protein